MNSNVEFLKARKVVVEKRIADSEDYKELKLLEKMISELSHTSISQFVEAFNSPKKIVRNSKEGYTRDTTNSPVPHIPYRERTAHVYNIVEDMVKILGGTAEIDYLTNCLKEDHNIIWPADKVSRLAGYIDLYNRTHPDDQRLSLWPEAKPGKKKPYRYLKVLYAGRERLANEA